MKTGAMPSKVIFHGLYTTGIMITLIVFPIYGLGSTTQQSLGSCSLTKRSTPVLLELLGGIMQQEPTKFFYLVLQKILASDDDGMHKYATFRH